MSRIAAARASRERQARAVPRAALVAALLWWEAMRGTLLVIAMGLAPAVARAEATGHSLVGFGFGPSATVSGELADELHGDGPAARLRMGGRFDRVGAELVLTAANLAGADGRRDTMVLTGPSLAWYAIAHRRVQVGVRGGVVVGAITGEHDGLVPCGPRDECEARPGTVTVTRRAYALDLGVTAQVALGPRHGSRAVLWIDLGTELGRFVWDDRVLTGRSTQLVIGVAHGIGF